MIQEQSKMMGYEMKVSENTFSTHNKQNTTKHKITKPKRSKLTNNNETTIQKHNSNNLPHTVLSFSPLENVD